MSYLKRYRDPLLPDDAIDIKVIPSLSDVNDRFAEWPSVQIELELAPWFWRLGWYHAPAGPHFLILYLGPIRVQVYA